MEATRPRPIPPDWRSESHEHLKSSYPRHDIMPEILNAEPDLVKGEKAEYSSHQPPASTTITMPAPPLISPSSTKNYGPPPPYSYPSSTITSTAGLTAYVSPPESRKAADDDRGPPTPSQIHRQSLPSINEALNGVAPSHPVHPYAVNTSQPMPPVSHSASNTPTTPHPRSHFDNILSGPPNPFAAGVVNGGHPLAAQERRPPPSFVQSPPLDPNARFASVHNNGTSSYPSQPRPAISPTSPSRSGARLPPHPYGSSSYPPAPQVITDIGPPASCDPRNLTPKLVAQSPTSDPHHFSKYSPSTNRPDVQRPDQYEDWRKIPPKETPKRERHYGEFVKRSLDVFQMEYSLNEIVASNERTLEWARHYRHTAQQNHRSGPSAPAMPTVIELDDMMNHHQRAMTAMEQIRDVIITQQNVLLERSRNEASKPPSEFGEDALGGSDKAEGAGGFAGGDPKKRRGRNAPPGRCHSCNRAETPEWRRGPDGARTLCNACGLHYAKLTRKNQQSNKSNMNSSNLRPKGSVQGSPVL